MNKFSRTGCSGASADRLEPPRLLISGGGGRLALVGDFACQFSADAEAAFDGVIVVDRQAAAALPELLRRRRAWLVPVADLSGSNAGYADICCSDPSPPSIRLAIEGLLRIVDALARLPDVVTAAEDEETLLLARAYSRGGTLQPSYDGGRPALLRYGAAGLLEAPDVIAGRLCHSGWFEQTFFDRLHVCPKCASSRLNVREECAACRSPQLSEESFIHHFRCGFQAAERHFAQGEALICPKCRRRLRHLGVDYDRPGAARSCQACGHVDGEPCIGFVCIDCGTHADAAQVGTRDWHVYTLTAAGEQRLLAGDLRKLRSGGSADSALFHSLADQWMRIQSRYGRPSVVLRVVFARSSAVRQEQGDRFLSAVRRQAVEIVRGELRDTDLLIETTDGLLVILPETEARSGGAPRERLLERLSSLLAADLGIEIRPIEPRQMSLAQISAA